LRNQRANSHLGEDVSNNLLIVVLSHEEELWPRENVVEVIPFVGERPGSDGTKGYKFKRS